MTYRSRLTVSVSGPNVMMVLRLNRDLGMDALWYIVKFYVCTKALYWMCFVKRREKGK